MNEYHINLNGKIVECKYGSEECNYEEHYESKELAEENLQLHLERQFGLFQEDNEMMRLIDKMYTTINSIDEYIETHTDEYINIQLNNLKTILTQSIEALIDGAISDDELDLMNENNNIINETIIKLKCKND